MTQLDKPTYKDNGDADSFASLNFANEHLELLKTAVKLEAKLNNTVNAGEWATYNTRFTTIDGQQIWFSGFNIGYGGTGPQKLLELLNLIHWKMNPDIIFINEELEITRIPPSSRDEQKEKKEKGKDT